VKVDVRLRRPCNLKMTHQGFATLRLRTTGLIATKQDVKNMLSINSVIASL